MCLRLRSCNSKRSKVYEIVCTFEQSI